MLVVRGQRLQRLDDGLRDRHVSLMAGFRADKRRVGRILQVDSIPPQREALALPHRRRAGERQERTHLSITFGLVPERTELRRRDDPIAARWFRPLPYRCNGIPVELSTLHGEVEDAVHDRAVMIHARCRELLLRAQAVQECIDDVRGDVPSAFLTEVLQDARVTGRRVRHRAEQGGRSRPGCLRRSSSGERQDGTERHLAASWNVRQAAVREHFRAGRWDD